MCNSIVSGKVKHSKTKSWPKTKFLTVNFWPQFLVTKNPCRGAVDGEGLPQRPAARGTVNPRETLLFGSKKPSFGLSHLGMSGVYPQWNSNGKSPFLMGKSTIIGDIMGLYLYIYLGMSENGVYPQWNSHLVGIMISKTIGCKGTLFSDKPIWC